MREQCDYIVDPTTNFNPYLVKAGDTIFVMIDFLSYFFEECHPLILFPYIIITHHFYDEADSPVPGKYEKYLDDPKIAGWFTHNVDRAPHPKLHYVPIGIGNSHYTYGDVDIFNSCIDNRKNNTERINLLYMNFSDHTYPSERKYVRNLFSNESFCKIDQGKPLQEYLQDLSQYKFTLSPRGNGLDCFRTWEALLMGCYPIVKSSTLDPLFEDLPVLIVEEWSQISEEFLEGKYQQMQGVQYMWEKLFMPYWIDKINEVKKQCRRELEEKSKK